jgi:hypothetical protein
VGEHQDGETVGLDWSWRFRKEPPPPEPRTRIFDDGSGAHTSLYWLFLLPGLMWA